MPLLFPLEKGVNNPFSATELWVKAREFAPKAKLQFCLSSTSRNKKLLTF